MAKGVKKRSDLWWAAFHNRRFDKHVYKRWVESYRKGKKLTNAGVLIAGDEHVTINNIYRAYHSSKTKPEYRAILLHSLFEDSDWLTESYNQFRKDKNRVTRVGLQIRKSKGELYIGLSTESKPTRLTPRMAENVKVRDIKAPTETGYIKALTTSGRKQQKVAYLLHEAQSALAAMIQAITTTIRLTDPFNRFGSPIEDDFMTPEYLDRPFLDGEKDSLLKRYEEITRGVREQFDQWSLVFDALGIDTSELNSKWDQLVTEISDYNSLEYDRPDVLANCHETAQEFAKIGYSYFKQLDDIDWSDPRIDRVPANLKVPPFVTPTVRRSYIKTMSADSAPEALKEWVKRNSKGLIDLE